MTAELAALAAATPLAGVWIAATVLLTAALAVSLWRGRRDRARIRRRLAIAPSGRQVQGSSRKPDISNAFITRAAAYLQQADPRQTKVLRARLVRAGFLDRRAIGLFLFVRVALLGLGLTVPALLSLVLPGTMSGNAFLIAILAGGAVGYKGPDLFVNRRIKALGEEARQAFPDFLDLMSVCANAGLSLEAALERVARELAGVYPNLSLNLSIACAEMRAGKPFDEALQSLGQRVPLDDIRPFSSLLQQSKELGTSLSEALRVYSEDMRHKRLSLAEEKAYALPAKLSIPVTACILPVVLVIAILPVVVRYLVGI